MQKPEISQKPRLRRVDPDSWGDLGFLYGVLCRRLDEPHSNISHQRLPSWEEHCKFVKSKPYWWHMIINEGSDDGLCLGVCYVSREGYIGIYVSPEHRRRGIALWTLRQLIDNWRETTTLWANINPRNFPSQRLFQRAGFVHNVASDKQITMRRMRDEQWSEPATTVD